MTNFEQTVGANERAKESMSEIQKTFSDANTQILTEQILSRNEQLEKLGDLNNAVRELAETLQALEDQGVNTVCTTARTDAGRAVGCSSSDAPAPICRNGTPSTNDIVPNPTTENLHDEGQQNRDEALIRDLHSHQLDEAQRYDQRGREKGPERPGAERGKGSSTRTASGGQPELGFRRREYDETPP